MPVQSRTLTDKPKTTETCELAKSGKRGVVKEKDLFNYMIIIPLQWILSSWRRPIQMPEAMLKWIGHEYIFKDSQGVVEAGAEPRSGNV
jgi:hypothetical protein